MLLILSKYSHCCHKHKISNSNVKSDQILAKVCFNSTQKCALLKYNLQCYQCEVHSVSLAGQEKTGFYCRLVYCVHPCGIQPIPTDVATLVCNSSQTSHKSKPERPNKNSLIKQPIYQTADTDPVASKLTFKHVMEMPVYFTPYHTQQMKRL